MNESFELPVHFNGKEMELPAQLHHYGYGYKIEVEVDGSSVFFERDDERAWRALANPGEAQKQMVNVELMQAIAASLEALFS